MSKLMKDVGGYLIGKSGAEGGGTAAHEERHGFHDLFVSVGRSTRCLVQVLRQPPDKTWVSLLGNELEAPKPDLTNRRLIVWTPAPARGASGVARAKALLLDGKNATWEHYGSVGHVHDDVGIL